MFLYVSDCGCDNECERFNDCCFPPQTTHSQRGLPKMTKQCYGFKEHEAYLLITSCPGLASDVCLTFSESAPWGSFKPYYSPQDGYLYFNKRCAQCNHATKLEDNDLIFSRIKCPDPYQMMHLNLKEMIDQNICVIEFVADVQIYQKVCKHRCSDGLRVCLEPNGVPFEIGLNFDTLKQLCLSYYSSPFCSSTNHYANIFCFACHTVKLESIRNPCADNRDQTGKDFRPSLSMLLDTSDVYLLTRTDQFYDTYSNRFLACQQVRVNTTLVSMNRYLHSLGLIKASQVVVLNEDM